LESGGAENRTVAITQKRSNTESRHAVRAIQQRLRSTGNMRCVSFYFERACPEQRPRGAGGAALPSCTQTCPGSGAAQSTPWRREKKTPATKSLSRTDNGNALCSLSQSCRRGRFQKA
jgi:hypothetical protein